MSDYLNILFNYLIIIPSSLLCFFPMKNQLKCSLLKLIIRLLILYFIIVPVMSWIALSFSLTSNAVLLPMLAGFYIFYHLSLTVSPDRSLAVFTYNCALMSILVNYGNGYDAIINPTSGADAYNIENTIFTFVLCSLVTLLLFYPMQKYGSLLIDKLLIPRVWYTTVIISMLILSINVLIRPIKYATLYTNKVFFVFWYFLAMITTLLFLLTVIFYFIVSGMFRQMDITEKNRMLEMQRSQYIKQQNYMQATAVERHNFRQTIRTLEQLAEAKDYDAIDKYLKKYVQSIPQNDIHAFCKNHAVNALLNYYAENAKLKKIRLHWVIDIPDSCTIADTDLCNVIGNLLENAIAACDELPEEKRGINLYIERPEMNDFLYIAMSNSFDGKVKMAKDRYLSTRHSGNGIGLSSIASIAEENDGSARFYHDGNVFNADITMKCQ